MGGNQHDAYRPIQKRQTEIMRNRDNSLPFAIHLSKSRVCRKHQHGFGNISLLSASYILRLFRREARKISRAKLPPENFNRRRSRPVRGCRTFLPPSEFSLEIMFMTAIVYFTAINIYQYKTYPARIAEREAACPETTEMPEKAEAPANGEVK